MNEVINSMLAYMCACALRGGPEIYKYIYCGLQRLCTEVKRERHAHARNNTIVTNVARMSSGEPRLLGAGVTLQVLRRQPTSQAQQNAIYVIFSYNS